MTITSQEHYVSCEQDAELGRSSNPRLRHGDQCQGLVKKAGQEPTECSSSSRSDCCPMHVDLLLLPHLLASVKVDAERWAWASR